MFKKNFDNLIAEIRYYRNSLSNKNGFLRNSVTLSVGTVIAQSFPILFSPVLTRLFSPEEFGLFAIISSVTAIIGVISTGKYETAVVIADDKKDAANLITLSLAISFSILIVSLIIFFFFSSVLVRMLNQPELKYWIYICPVSAFFISIYQCYNEWCIRNGRFLKLAYNKIINAGSITMTNLAFGISRFKGGGLVLGDFIGRFISAVVCAVSFFRMDSDSLKKVTFQGMKSIAARYSNCPRYILPGQLLNMIGGQLPILLITHYYSKTEVGFFSLATMALTVPVSMITVAVRDVFKQRANEEYKLNNNCIAIYRKTANTLIFVSVVSFTILFFFLPDIFQIVFGAKWRVAGEFARIFCPMVMINFVSESFTGMYYVANKMSWMFIWQVLYLSFSFLSLFIGYFYFKEISSLIICFVAGRIIVDLTSLSMTYRLAKGY